ncbi:MAG: hypothetical protein KME20_01430 [Kaiparowitsia implicata GSE-PSE-MK54-09C]|jgi:hypothetical protein|nr:hypothetical protein [Kaiparowitsia implicata GSE-PSE-MK54-09C]
MAISSYYNRPTWLDSVLSRSAAAGYLVGGIVCFFMSQAFVGFCLCLAAVYADPKGYLKLQSLWSGMFKRMGLSPAHATGLVFGIAAGGFIVLAWVEPAHAQFFGNAETFFTEMLDGSELGAGGTAIVEIVMNTIRALFIIYLIFGLVSVINAARQGEEWKDLAKTPFMVLVCGILGDVLVGAIAGT